MSAADRGPSASAALTGESLPDRSARGVCWIARSETPGGGWRSGPCGHGRLCASSFLSAVFGPGFAVPEDGVRCAR